MVDSNYEKKYDLKNKKQKIKNKTKMFLLLLFVLINGSYAQNTATSGTCGNWCMWDYNNQTKTLNISGSDTISDAFNAEQIPWYPYHEEIEKVIVGENITSIGMYTFFNMTHLKNVSLPSTLTSIKTFAFTFCGKLENITLPQNLQSIGDYAFGGCWNLKSIEIPKSVSLIPASFCNSCYSLKEVILHEGLETIEEYAFAFCYKLTKINIPSTVTTFGMASFANAYSLTKLTIPKSVEVISTGFCLGCKSLKEVIFEEGSSPLFLDQEAFRFCTNLESISLPGSIQAVGNWAFADCDKLKTINFNGSEQPECGYYIFNNTKGIQTINVYKNYTNNTLCEIPVSKTIEPPVQVDTQTNTNNQYEDKYKTFRIVLFVVGCIAGVILILFVVVIVGFVIFHKKSKDKYLNQLESKNIIMS